MKTCPQCQLRYPEESTFCFIDGATLQAREHSVLGSSVAGRYRVEDLVADGPVAGVYRARHRLLTTPCVLKLHKEPLDAADRQAFVDAVKLGRRCVHPYVVPIVSGGVDEGGRGFVVSPLYDGTPLSAQLEAGPMPLEQATSVLVQILLALDRAHDLGVAHGDLRPANALLGNDGSLLLTDLGVGRTAHRPLWEDAPAALGAQHYLAPELCEQERRAVGPITLDGPEAAADLYALGATAYQMLSGKLPVQARTVAELRQRLGALSAAELQAGLPELPEGLAEWLLGLLAPATEERPATVQQAMQGLGAICERASLPVPAEPESEVDYGLPSKPELEPTFARWQRYRPLFVKLVELGFPAGPPDNIQRSLAELGQKADALEQLASQARGHHQGLDDVLRRARDGRLRIAAQMLELSRQVAALRGDLQPPKIAAKRHADKAAALQAELQAAHREVIRWEGLSGFREPYMELAQAYRRAADLVESWWSVSGAQKTCATDGGDKEQQLGGLDARLEELRQALRIHESNLDAELSACERALSELGSQADAVHPEILSLATRLVAPLRAKPELASCFKELEQVR